MTRLAFDRDPARGAKPVIAPPDGPAAPVAPNQPELRGAAVHIPVGLGAWLVGAGLVALVGVAAAQTSPEASQAPARAPVSDVTTRSAEEGRPFIRGYAPVNVGGNGQFWAIVQDKRGVIYAGTGAAVLEFDGASWRRIPLGVARRRSPGRSPSTTPAASTSASVRDLGYLAPGCARRIELRLAARQAARRCPRCQRGLRTHADPGRRGLPVGAGRVPMGQRCLLRHQGRDHDSTDLRSSTAACTCRYRKAV